VAQLSEAMCYKPEGRGFDSALGPQDFSFSGHTMALGLIQPLTEMNTRDISLGRGVKEASAYG
jgi:hypothetical protein